LLGVAGLLWQANLMQVSRRTYRPTSGVLSVASILLVAMPILSVTLAGCAEKAVQPAPAKPVELAKTPAAVPVPLDPPAPTAAPVPVDQPTSFPAMNDPAFDTWRASLRAEAIAQGIKPQTFDQAFAGLMLNPRVIQLDRNQPDVKTNSASYISRRLTAARISQGRRMRTQHAAMFAEKEQTYGVSADVMVGIWGMETSYGADMGSFDVVRSLTSLAYDGRRSAMFRRELLAALAILDQGRATRSQLRGSWAGAMGHPQFMPTSYLTLGRDGDGDGKVDIWSNLPDVFASMGNYLQSRGWKPGINWGFQVTLPQGYDPTRYVPLDQPANCKRALEKHSALRPVAQWKQDGLIPTDSASQWPADTALASVVLPDGPGGPAYLATENYRVVLNYNCSNYYALSVLMLSDRVGNTPVAVAQADY
jgi:membrane-bound lytic murein transglycosylase B